MLCLNCIRLLLTSKHRDLLKLAVHQKNFRIFNQKSNAMTFCIKKQSSYFHTSSEIAGQLDFFKQHNQDKNNNAAKQLDSIKISTRIIEDKPDLSVLEPIVVSLDCEMVQTTMSDMSLARCSVISYQGEVLVDVYVKQKYPVLNYHTRYSGITREQLLDPNCLTYIQAQKEVLNAIDGKIVVGHSIKNDLKSLKVWLPSCQVIDIACLPDVVDTLRVNFPDNKRTSLQVMSKLLLNQSIQTHTHCSVEDARATINIFKLISHLWLDSNKTVVEKFTRNPEMFKDEYWAQYTNN